jgi:hypothetical protein
MVSYLELIIQRRAKNNANSSEAFRVVSRGHKIQQI